MIKLLIGVDRRIKIKVKTIFLFISHHLPFEKTVDEKLPMRISRRIVALNCFGVEIIMNEKGEVFTYEYTAKQQKEIREIREKYQHKPNEITQMDKLRRLDASVTKKEIYAPLTVGVLGCLILGTGMSCVMVWGGHFFLIGAAIGIIGLIGVICGYPLYMHITKKERDRLAPEILKLVDELLK